MSDASPNQSSKQTVQSEPQRFWKKLFLGGLVSLCLFGFIVWICLFSEVPLEISPETTYITEPLTADGKQVDYFRAIELMRYPPNMKTDKNGFRMVIRAIGVGKESTYLCYAIPQIHEKLGLDPAVPPTMTFEDPHNFIQKHVDSLPSEEPKPVDSEANGSMSGEGLPGMGQGMGRASNDFEKNRHLKEQLGQQITRPWTAEELPMMAEWLTANEPAIDLIAQAARQPNFASPWIRENENTLLIDAQFSETVRYSAFARALSTRANYRIAQGNLDGAIDDIIACKTIGRHASYHGCASEYLIGLASENIATEVGIAASLQHQPTESQLQRLFDTYTKTIGTKIPQREDPKETLLIERYMILDAAQKLSQANSAEKHEILRAIWYPPIALRILTHLGCNWNTFMETINHAYDHPETLDNISTSFSPNLLFPNCRSKFYGKLLAHMFGSCADSFYGAVNQAECRDQMQAITLAILIYEKQYGHLPPTWTIDGQGKLLHSWRVLLLPYLGKEAKKLYEKIRLDEPWNSEHNRQLHEAAIPFYQCPSAGLAPGKTVYTVIIGAKTAFRDTGQGVKLDEFGPSSANLLLVAERKTPVCWMDPANEISETDVQIEIGSKHPYSLHCGFRDGHVTSIHEDLILNPQTSSVNQGYSSDIFQKLLKGTAEAIPNPFLIL